ELPLARQVQRQVVVELEHAWMQLFFLFLHGQGKVGLRLGHLERDIGVVLVGLQGQFRWFFLLDEVEFGRGPGLARVLPRAEAVQRACIQLVLAYEQHRPYLEAIAWTDALSFRDWLAIQPGAVDAAKVLDGEEALDQFKPAMLATDGGRGNPQSATLLAPDQHLRRAHPERVPAACPTL